MGDHHTHPLRLAFYGDDFTGSTDALEVLAFAGLRCALFLKTPTMSMLNRFGGFDAIGIAGDSRSMSPIEMDATLPAIFDVLTTLGAPIIHYKVCSTFDSSPTIGSIGRVIDIAHKQRSGVIPIIAGTPALQRYCVFGNLFARSGTDGMVYRIDRHPIMSRHPVTPMGEGDLAVHLNRQTPLSIGGFRLPMFELDEHAREAEMDKLFAGNNVAALFDTANSEHLTEIGRLLEREAEKREKDEPIFVIGSSGMEYALTQWWKSQGRLPTPPHDYEYFDEARCILAVSGSASPLSALQVDAAIKAGFEEIAINATLLIGENTWRAYLADIVAKASSTLRAGHSIMLHTARGPDDARIDAMITQLAQDGMDCDQARHHGGRLLGQRLGHLTHAILHDVPLQRLVISGGDTSSHITQTLGPDALKIVAKLAPGAPLCQLISTQPELDGLEISLKGGQMGQIDFFVTALKGNRRNSLQYSRADPPQA